jgi:hypothetical protein
MPGDLAMLTPFGQQRGAVELSQTLFRKQLLPLGKINYKGREINFDKTYLADLAASFRDQAFDQVPFLLAKDDNAHTLDPERFRGEVKGVEVTAKGLDIMLDLTPEAAEMIRKNPRLGVSARIIEGLDRADGKKFPRAIQHVLGTLDPRVTGMSPWQEVSLSEEVSDTLDMTTEEVQMSDTVPSVPAPVPPAPPQATSTQPTSPPPTPTAPSGTSREPRPIMPNIEDENYDDITDDELEALADEAMTQTASSLSSTGRVPVDLIEASNVENRERIQQLELELARQRFVNEARTFIESGVPPVLVELARPILCLPKAPVIDLSNNEHIDVGDLVRDMLEQTKGFIELAKERGSTYNPRDTVEERADEVLSNWSGGKS